VFLTKPLVMRKSWAQVPNGRLLTYECPEEAWLDRVAELAGKAGVPDPMHPIAE
jgi:hypothetical protein